MGYKSLKDLAKHHYFFPSFHSPIRMRKLKLEANEWQRSKDADVLLLLFLLHLCTHRDGLQLHVYTSQSHM